MHDRSAASGVWQWARMGLAVSALGLFAGLAAAQNPPQIPCPFCTDPVERIWKEIDTATRVKSPAPQMRFTAGTPLRLLADALDVNAGECPPGHPPYVCPGVEVRFFVDGGQVGAVGPSASDYNLWELRLPNGLPEGDHVITVKYVPYNPATHTGGTPIDGLVPVTIHLDPAPHHGGTITLTQNLVLHGSTDLNWTDKTIVGNGFTVTSAAGYSGHVTIEGSHIMGLGDFDTVGIDITTSSSISVQHSIFEATGAMRFIGTGSAAVTVKANELRANNMVTFVSSDPSVPVVLELGGGSGTKVVQGNRIGTGMLNISSGNAWQIGGLNPGEGNVLIGARAVLHIINSSHDIIQGNYLHHDYHGGFSQGFNLLLEGSSGDELVEHNVIRGSSWPVQNFGGEFRFNLLIDSGHNFWRSAQDDAQIHHNVFSNASGPNSGYDGALYVYSGESGLNIYNNTFDVGGATGQFDAPAFNIGQGSLFQSIRNNLFVGFSDINGFGKAFVSAPNGSITSARVTSADFNAWFNPLAPHAVHYLPGIVAGTPGVHDVTGDPKLSGAPEIPYRIAESCIWIGSCTVAQVLEHYREVYRPAAGSPLIGAGKPATGSGTVAIGAIGADDSDPTDLFGRPQPFTAPPPQPAISYYLSEGATGPFFDEDILLANPSDQAAPVTLTFFKEDGEQVVATRSLAPQSHLTVHVDTIPGLEATSASAQVTSDSGVPLIVERTMFWDKSYYAGSTGSAVDQPSQNWFFAEGSQGFFQTYVLVINPNSTSTDVTFTFQREAGAPVQRTITLGGGTRLTLDTGTIPDLVNQSFGIAVHATQPIMAERSMYFGSIYDGPTLKRLWSGGTESAGVTAPSAHWFLAEGATGGFFTTFVLLSNPQTTAAHVQLQYLLDNGQTITVPKTIGPNARLTTNIGAEDDVRLHDAAVSTVVTSGVPIIAERSMYWPGAAVPWGEGHNSVGVVDAGTTWGLAEGRVGGPLNFHSYILLANPQTNAATVTVTFLRDTGGPVVLTYTVPPTSRVTLDANGVQGLQDSSFGALIEVTNQVPIIVERSMYWDSNGFLFSGGTNVTGVHLP